MSLIEPPVELGAVVGKQLARSTEDQLSREGGRRLAFPEQWPGAPQRLI
jgi:hypothetical protein